MMVMIALRAYLHQIGHYDELDIASPQSGNIVQQPLSSPHFGGLQTLEESSMDRYRLGILLWASSEAEGLPPSFTRERFAFHLRACHVAHQLQSALERRCQPAMLDWIRVAAIVNRIKVSEPDSL